MKNKTLFVLSFLVMLLAGCNGCHFSKGVKKDFTTGLSYSYNGLAVEDVYLGDIDDKKRASNKVNLGESVKIVANDVQHLTEKDGRIFPGCSMLVTNSAGEKFLAIDDLFAKEINGISPQRANVITAKLDTGSPLEKGKTYQLKVEVFDKLKPEQRLVVTVDLQIE